MSKPRLENLLRLAGEIDELEATFSRRGDRLRAGSASSRARMYRLVPFFAGAIAAGWAWLCIQPAAAPVRSAANLASLAFCHLPTDTRTQRVTVDRLDSGPGEPAYLLALTRTWNRDCDCLLWDLLRWADGTTLASTSTTSSLELDVATSPSAGQQVLVLAMAPERGKLARPAADGAAELLNCLNSREPLPAGDQDAPTYAKAVESCLPQGVTIVSHPLSSRGR